MDIATHIKKDEKTILFVNANAVAGLLSGKASSDDFDKP
jgi:hypothetical protein